MAGKTLKVTTMLMLVMLVMHIVSATSDFKTCKDDCVKACTIAEELVDFGCYLTCAEKCGGDDDDDDYPDPPILTGAHKFGKQLARRIKVTRSFNRGIHYE